MPAQFPQEEVIVVRNMKRRVAAGAAVIGLGGLGGIALSSNHANKPTTTLAAKPEVRTHVIRRTIHVTKHVKPRHPVSGTGAGGGATIAATGSPGTYASGTAPVTGASSTGAASGSTYTSSAPITTSTSGAAATPSPSSAPSSTPVVTHTSGGGGGSASGGGGGSSPPVVTHTSGGGGGAGGGGGGEHEGGDHGD